MSPRTRAWLSWAPAILWAVVIFALSAQPSLPSAGVSDKQAHLATYALLAGLCLMGLTGWRQRRIAGGPALVAFVMAVLYGVSDEWHQSFVPGRTPDVADVAADAIGAALVVGGAWAWAILLAGRTSPRQS